jgi:hypothetical protein
MPPMKRYLAPVLCCLQIITASAADPWWQVFGEIKPSEFHGGITNGEKPADEQLRDFLATSRFDEWETHEDDLVKLSYPKHPLLKLEVNGGESGIRVEGGVCTTVDNSFQRAYVLKAGPFTYGVFLVAKADWLDDGICLCGPMVHHVYRMDNSCLVRFSLLPGGAVKKAQKLGGKLRLMAFEWTHLACPREVYEQLVERMILKLKHPWDAPRFEEEIAKRYGMAGRSGWLHPGTPLAEADRIMGSNAVPRGGMHRWFGIQNDYPCELTAEFKEGRLVKLADEGLHPTGEAAVKGSYHWIDDRLKEFAGGVDGGQDVLPPSDEPKKAGPRPTPEQLAELSDAIVKLTASTRPDEWWEVADLIDRITDAHGVRDPRLVVAVINHGCGDATELRILKRCSPERLPDWLDAKLTAMRSEKPSAQGPGNMFSDPISDRAGCASGLLGELVQTDASAAAAHAQELFATDEPAWTLAVLMAIDSFDQPPLPPQQLVIESLARARKARSNAIATSALDLAKDAADLLTDPAGVEKAILALPKGEPDGDWEKSKAEALDAIKRRPATSAPEESPAPRP